MQRDLSPISQSETFLLIFIDSHIDLGFNKSAVLTKSSINNSIMRVNCLKFTLLSLKEDKILHFYLLNKVSHSLKLILFCQSICVLHYYNRMG